MARTRRDLEATAKRAELVAAARRLFLSEGYDATGMARVARAAGVAPNTVYWYFDDKDALLVAVLDDLVVEAVGAYAEVRDRPVVEQLPWLLDRFEGARELVTTVHARLATSASVRDWHDRFHLLLEALIVERLAEAGVPEARRSAAARLALFVVEGLLSHHAGDADDRRGVVALLASFLEPAR